MVEFSTLSHWEIYSKITQKMKNTSLHTVLEVAFYLFGIRVNGQNVEWKQFWWRNSYSVNFGTDELFLLFADCIK